MFQKNKPEPFINDHRNSPIELGKKVAFNRSGDIEFGEIISFSSEWKQDKYTKYKDPQGRVYWRHIFSLQVKREDGGVSTVKNYRSFLII